jgi:hypothetical protein
MREHIMISATGYRAMGQHSESLEQHMRLETEFLPLLDQEESLDGARVQERARLTLTTLDDHGQDFADGVRFMMMDGPTRVICWVSREALDYVEFGNPSPGDRLARFERHRTRLEEIASTKYDAGEKSPIVMSFDCTDLRRG